MENTRKLCFAIWNLLVSRAFFWSAKALFLLSFCALSYLAHGQLPSEQLKKGYRLVSEVEFLGEYKTPPETTLNLKFRETFSFKDGKGHLSVTDEQEQPSQRKEIVFQGDESLSQSDFPAKDENDFRIRFRRSKEPFTGYLFEVNHYLEGKQIQKLLRNRTSSNGKHDFYEEGDHYVIETFPNNGLVKKIDLKFGTGNRVVANVSDYKNFDGLWVPTKVERTTWYGTNPENTDKIMIVTRLKSVERISKVEFPFTKESLPFGSSVQDMIDLKQYKVDKNGRWVAVGTIKPPDTQQVMPATAARAKLFTASLSALLLVGTCAVLLNRKRVDERRLPQ